MVDEKKKYLAKLLRYAADQYENCTEEDELDEVARFALQCACSLADYPERIDFMHDYDISPDDAIEDIEQIISDECCPIIYTHRSEEEIEDYMDEAFDKVWYCRTSKCDNPEIEKVRQAAVKRIEETYKDLAKLTDENTGNWEYGYWSGILAALRWATGDEKDFLDT